MSPHDFDEADDEADEADEAGEAEDDRAEDEDEAGEDAIVCTVDTDCDADELCTAGLCSSNDDDD